MAISKKIEEKVNQLDEKRGMKNLMLKILKEESNGAISSQAAKSKYSKFIDQYLEKDKGGQD